MTAPALSARLQLSGRPGPLPMRSARPALRESLGHFEPSEIRFRHGSDPSIASEGATSSGRLSTTPRWLPPWSTGCCIAPRPSTLAARATGCESTGPEPRPTRHEVSFEPLTRSWPRCAACGSQCSGGAGQRRAVASAHCPRQLGRTGMSQCSKAGNVGDWQHRPRSPRMRAVVGMIRVLLKLTNGPSKLRLRGGRLADHRQQPPLVGGCFRIRTPARWDTDPAASGNSAPRAAEGGLVGRGCPRPQPTPHGSPRGHGSAAWSPEFRWLLVQSQPASRAIRMASARFRPPSFPIALER